MDLCSCTGRTFLISQQGELNLAYETFHTRILYFERYVRTLTYSILAYAYSRALISGTGKATDFKFGGYIYRANPNKSPFKILEKRERGRIQGLPNFFGYPLTGKSTDFKF